VLSLQSFSVLEMTECAAGLRKLGAGASSVEDAAQRIARYLFESLGHPETFAPDCALVRCFLTRAYQDLDAAAQASVREAFEGEIEPQTACLTLLGTAGEQPDWNAREHSRRYRAIPLVSPAFLAQFPMFSQLLKQLGVDLHPSVSDRCELLLEAPGGAFNIFYVAEARDSPYVPVQQEFVLPFGIRSVLGFGAILAPQEFFVVVLFTKVSVTRETAELFKPLALSAKLALLPFSRPLREYTVIRVEHRPSFWPSKAETLEHLLLVHEHTVAEQVQRHRQAVDALRAKDEQYRLLVMQANDILYRTDAGGYITFVNPTAVRVLKYSEPEFLGRRFVEFIRPDYRDRTERFYGRQFVRKRGNTYYECPVVAKDGTEVWIGQHVQLLQDRGQVVGFQAVARDITERHRAEARVRESERQLRERVEEVRLLTGRLTTIEEQEQARIARELHDELGGRLSSLKLDLMSVLSLVQDRQGIWNRTLMTERIHAMVIQVEVTMASVHRLVTGLRPVILDDLGLVAAIEWYCQDFQARSGIRTTCVASADDIPMEAEQATALYRIHQEALTNIARHAQAAGAIVTLTASEDEIRLEVADDGIGIPVEKITDRQSLGLLGMRERVARLGGHLSIEGRPGRGTTVIATLPRRRPDSQKAGS